MRQQTPPDSMWAFDLLWIGFLALYAFAGYSVTPFHGDESMQIFMSRDYAYQFIDDNLETIFYDEAKEQDIEQGLRLINGTINKYTIGLAWHLAGYDIDDLNKPWYWDLDYQFNIDNGFYPSDALLLTSRIPSALFLALSVVAFFIAVWRFAGRPAAYIATTLYAINPAVLINGRRAMMEGSLLLGVTLTLLAGILLVQQRGWRSWAATSLLALGTGFAVASKHTNVIVVFSVFVGIFLHMLVVVRRDGLSAILTRFAQILVAGLVSIALFFALNPAWWQNPIEVAQFVLDERVELLTFQTEIFDGYDNRWEQFVGLYRHLFVNEPMYFEAEEFRDPIASNIYTYEQTPYAGIQFTGIAPFLSALFVLGWVITLGGIKSPDIQNDARWVVITWGLISVLFVWFATPLEWQRYYLIAQPVVAALAPVGIVWIFRHYAQDAETNSPEYKRGSARVKTTS